MLNQPRPYGVHKIIVHERTAVAPKVSFAVFVPYHPVDYKGMNVESAAAEIPILKKPFLFDLDVLRAIFERIQGSDERLMKFLLPTTRPTRTRRLGHLRRGESARADERVETGSVSQFPGF